MEPDKGMGQREPTTAEKQFTQAVATALSSQGFTVQIGETIHPGSIVADILARRDSTTIAVEIAPTSDRIRSAISKAAYMRLLPPIMESYVAVPQSIMSNDVYMYASVVGVGVYGVSGNQIVSSIGAQRISVNLNLQYGYPKNVSKGQEFAILVSVRNLGQKMGWQLKVSCEIAYPFMNSTSGKNEETLESLNSGEEKQVSLSLKVDPNAVPGTYPVFIRVEGPGFEPNISSIQVIVS